MDPREALLSIAKDAEADPMWVLPAYRKTQPNAVFSTNTDRQENVKYLDSTDQPACKHCGLKLCTCRK